MQNTGHHWYLCVDLRGRGGVGNRVKGRGGNGPFVIFDINYWVQLVGLYYIHLPQKELQIFLFVYCNARQGYGKWVRLKKTSLSGFLIN